MRIAALVFGILAGLVASLILALGGLDPSVLRGADPRQLSFVLFVVANLGVLGAGVVLAAPLVGLALLIVAALAWIGAAVALHHGPDYVMLTPPVLLLVAAVFAAVALVRGRGRSRDERSSRAHAIAIQRAAMADGGEEDERDDEEEEDDREDQRGAVRVGASFFGEAGTAMPLSGVIPRREPADPEPIRRPTERPRQQPVFRVPEDEYDEEESGVARLTRVLASILTFGLYAGLAAVVALTAVNMRTSQTARSDAVAGEAALASAAAPKPSSVEVAQAPRLELPTAPAAASSVPAPVAPVLAPALPSTLVSPIPGDAPPVVAEVSQTTAAPVSEPAAAPSEPVAPPAAEEPASPLLPGMVIASTGPTATPVPAARASPSVPDAAETPAAPGAVMPLPVPPQLAAQRTRPAPRIAPAAPPADTGL